MNGVSSCRSRSAGRIGRHAATGPGQPAARAHQGGGGLVLLQGAMTYPAGERLIRMSEGDFIYLPREVPHAFRATGTVPVRFLALTLPGGLLDICDAVGVPAAEGRCPTRACRMPTSHAGSNS